MPRSTGCFTVATLLLLTGTLAAQQPEPIQPGPPVRDADHLIARRVASWKSLRERNLILQRRDYSCGAAALATLVKYHLGDPATEDQFLKTLDAILTDKEIVDRIKNGLALSDLRKAAVREGYQSVAAKLTLDKLCKAKTPLIVGITDDSYDHFVVYRGADSRYVYLADPIRGNLRLPIEKFAKQWQKNLVLAVAKPGAKVKTHSLLSISSKDTDVGRTNRQLIVTTPSRIATDR